MKRLFIFLSLALTFFNATAQTPRVPQWLGAPNTMLTVRGDIGVDSALGLPIRDTNFIPRFPPPSNLPRPGVMIIKPQDWKIYIYDTVGTDHWSELKTPEETLTGDLGIRQRKAGTVITTENKGRAFAAVSDMRTYTGDIYRDWVFRVSDVTGVRDYRVDTLDTTTPDDGVLTIVNTAPGRASNHARLKLQFSGPLDARWFGAEYRLTNNQPGLLAAVTAASTAPVKTVLVSGGPYALTSNLTVPAGVVLQIAPGAMLTGPVTITGGIIDAGYRQQLFTTDLTIHPEGCLNGKFSMLWYGAKGDGSDDQPELQKPLDVCAYQNKIKHLFWPGGSYTIAKGLYWERDDNGDGVRDFLTGYSLEGEGKTFGGANETLVSCPNGNSFGFNIQRGKGVVIENIFLLGNNSAISALSISDVMENNSANWENGNRDQQTSPHAGWVIDGFGPPSFGSGSKYPDFVAKYSDATNAGSTDIKLINCGARYWVVGFMLSPAGVVQNGDLVEYNACWSDYCETAFATGSSQNRTNRIIKCAVWGHVKTVVDCKTYGDNIGDPPHFDGLNVAGYVRQFCILNDFLNAGLIVENSHFELLRMLGGSPASDAGDLVMENSWVNFAGDQNNGDGTVLHHPITLFRGASLTVKGGTFTNYSAGFSPQSFSAKWAYFEGVRIDNLLINNYAHAQTKYFNVKLGVFPIGEAAKIDFINPTEIGDQRPYFLNGMEYVTNLSTGDNYKSVVRRKIYNTAFTYSLKDAQLVLLGNFTPSGIQNPNPVSGASEFQFTVAPSSDQYKMLQVGDVIVSNQFTDEFGRTFSMAGLGTVSNKNGTTGVITVQGNPTQIAAVALNLFLYRPHQLLPVFVTANSTAGSPVLSNYLIEQDCTVLPVGITINSPNFPEGTYIVSYDFAARTITLSNNATATVTNMDVLSSDWQGEIYGHPDPALTGKVGFKKGDKIWNKREDLFPTVLYWICNTSGITNSSRQPAFTAFYKTDPPQFVDDAAADAAGVTFYVNTTSNYHRIKNIGQPWLDIPTWNSNTMIYNQGGDIEFRTGNGTPSAKVLASKQLVAYQGIAYQANQVVTTAGATTIGSNITTVYVDPPSVLASATFTLPPSPVDGQEVRFMFGGQITAGNPVVTSLSIIANTGQSMLSVSAPSATSNDLAIYQYRAANTTWYRAN